MDATAMATRLVTPRRRRSTDATPDAVVHFEEGDVAVFRSGDGPHRALLVHGWEGIHSDLATTAAALADDGWTTISPDLPAHGASSGTSMTIPEGARAILAVDAALGPFELVVAHSVGSAVAVLALTRGLRAKRVVLVTPPANYPKALEGMARHHGADDDAVAAILSVLRARSPDLDELDSPKLVACLTQEGSVVVASRDKVLSPEAGRAISVSWAGGRLLEVDAGHLDVLEDQALLAEVMTQARLARGSTDVLSTA